MARLLSLAYVGKMNAGEQGQLSGRMNNSKKFEQQIHRIHELLGNSAAIVTWNDHFPDPDNPSQQRQVDISVRRDNRLTVVECRCHQCPQDVQWIEELIGRRTSLKADTIIAVSSCGFTRGALKKAGRYQIILRDLCELTDAEIASWGRRVALTLYFYEYSDLKLCLWFDRESVHKIDASAVKTELAKHPGITSLFNAAAKVLDSANLISRKEAAQPLGFGVRVQMDGFVLSGELVLQADFEGKVRLTPKQVEARSVFGYGEPEKIANERHVLIETFDLGSTSVTHDKNRVSVLLDVSHVKMPPFCQFRYFRVDGQGEEMDVEAFELVGIEKFWIHKGRMSVKLCALELDASAIERTVQR
jgi:hypothetical protein